MIFKYEEVVVKCPYATLATNVRTTPFSIIICLNDEERMTSKEAIMTRYLIAGNFKTISSLNCENKVQIRTPIFRKHRPSNSILVSSLNNLSCDSLILTSNMTILVKFNISTRPLVNIVIVSVLLLYFHRNHCTKHLKTQDLICKDPP